MASKSPVKTSVTGFPSSSPAVRGGKHRGTGFRRRRGWRRRRDSLLGLREERRAAHLAAHAVRRRASVRRRRGTGRRRRRSRLRFGDLLVGTLHVGGLHVGSLALAVAVGEWTGRRRALRLLRGFVGGSVGSSRVRRLNRVHPPFVSLAAGLKVERTPGGYGRRHHLFLLPRRRREHGAPPSFTSLRHTLGVSRWETLGSGERPGVLRDSLRRREGIPSAPEGPALLPV